MSNKKYTFDKRTSHIRERVNAWQLNKQVKEQARKIQLLERALQHQAGANAQQVLLNESLSDRLALLEKAQWKREDNVFRRCVARFWHN